MRPSRSMGHYARAPLPFAHPFLRRAKRRPMGTGHGASSDGAGRGQPASRDGIAAPSDFCNPQRSAYCADWGRFLRPVLITGAPSFRVPIPEPAIACSRGRGSAARGRAQCRREGAMVAPDRDESRQHVAARRAIPVSRFISQWPMSPGVSQFVRPILEASVPDGLTSPAAYALAQAMCRDSSPWQASQATSRSVQLVA
jgi:hypothetical protein